MKYFKHMTNLRFDPEARKMIKKFGPEGYCLYVVFMETAAESVEAKKVDPRLSESIEDLAEYFNMDPSRAAEMTAYALAENIIQMDEGHLICEKVHELLDEYLSKSSTMRESMEVYKTGSRSVQPAEEVLEYLNELLTQNSNRRGYKPVRDNLAPIEGRLAAGFSAEDCKRVCMKKYNDWNGTDRSKYLRPKTLFRKCNFEGYLNEASEEVQLSDDEIREALRLES